MPWKSIEGQEDEEKTEEKEEDEEIVIALNF